VQASREWDNMTPPPSSLTEYAAPLAIGSASLVASVLLDVPVAHALIVSVSLVGGMAAGTVARLYARRLRPPRTDG
jgi:hypothetical protein